MQEQYEQEEENLNATLTEKKAEIADFDEQIAAAAEAAAQEAAQREAEAAAAAEQEESGEMTVHSRMSLTTAHPLKIHPTVQSRAAALRREAVLIGKQFLVRKFLLFGKYFCGTGNCKCSLQPVGSFLCIWRFHSGICLDCSGLVQYCHSVAGISLPRTSYAQVDAEWQ